MFGGGDQLRLFSLIGDTPLHHALLKRYQRGGCIIDGISAGAAVLPEVMIFQNNRFRLFRKGGTEMIKGLGLIQDMIFDIHFVQRSRISRLVHAMATHPALLGLGIEENTGLIIENEQQSRVIGNGTVIVVDGSAIQINHSGYAENREQRTENNSGPTAPPKSHFPNPKKTRHNQNLREKEILTLEETLILKQLSGFVKSAQSNQSCVFGYTNMVTNLQALRYLIGQNSNGARLRFRS